MATGNVSEERIKSWRRLVLSIRKQTDKVSDCVSTPQLALLLQSILVGTMAIFIALMNGFGTDSAGIMPSCLSIFIWALGRLFHKASLAEDITTEVSGSCLMTFRMSFV